MKSYMVLAILGVLALLVLSGCTGNNYKAPAPTTGDNTGTVSPPTGTTTPSPGQLAANASGSAVSDSDLTGLDNAASGVSGGVSNLDQSNI